MTSTIIEQLKVLLSGIKTTPSGLVEYNNNSLQSVLNLALAIFQARGRAVCADVAEMSDLEGNEGIQAFVQDVGDFILLPYSPGTAPDNVTTFASTTTNSLWTKQEVSVDGLPGFTIASPANGQTLVYDSVSNTFKNVAVNPSLAWTSVTGKPTLATKATLAFNLPGTPTYAGNAQAIAGGLVVDDVYKLSSGELRIVI